MVKVFILGVIAVAATVMAAVATFLIVLIIYHPSAQPVIASEDVLSWSCPRLNDEINSRWLKFNDPFSSGKVNQAEEIKILLKIFELKGCQNWMYVP